MRTQTNDRFHVVSETLERLPIAEVRPGRNTGSATKGKRAEYAGTQKIKQGAGS